MAENIEFRLKVIEDKLGLALDNNEKKAKSLGSAINVALGSFASAAAIKGISLVSDGFRQLNSFVLDSVKAASDSQNALNSLNLALSQTGNLTEENVKSLQDFAAEIQNTTAFEDDAVISTAAYIQTLARLDTDGLQRATQAAIDLSAALGIDLESASTIVAKSAEGNTTALQKLGIAFEKGKSDAETFANVLTTLESRFGGSAEAQVKTFSGSIAQLSNVFNSVQENIGNVIIKNPAVIASFKTISAVLVSLGDSINSTFGKENSDQLANFISASLNGLAGLVTVIDAFGRIATASIEAVLGSIRLLALGIVTPIAGLLELIATIPKVGESFRGAADAATAEMNRLSEAANANAQGIQDAFSGDTTLGGLATDIVDANNKFNTFYNDIKTKQEDLKNNPAPSVTGLDDAELKRVDALNAQLIEAQQNFLVSKAQLEAQNQLDEDARFQAKTTADIQKITDFELQKSQIQYDAAIAASNLLGTAQEVDLARKKAGYDRELRDANIKNKGIADIRKNELDNQNAFFASATSLASSNNKELAAIGKAAALTQIAINTPKAASAAYIFGQDISGGNPAVGAIFAGIAYAAQAAQAARVAGIQGFANGGIIGATPGPDNQVATVRTGEMVLNADQQKNLFDMINNGSSGGDIVIQVDGREIARAVRSQVQQGYKLS
jgi:hypothetical protein